MGDSYALGIHNQLSVVMGKVFLSVSHLVNSGQCPRALGSPGPSTGLAQSRCSVHTD